MELTGSCRMGKGATSSLPVCPLCQPAGDLPGGPGAPVGVIKVNFLPQASASDCSGWLGMGWGALSITSPAFSLIPGYGFFPAHGEFVFVDLFIFQLPGCGEGAPGSE